MRIRHNGQRFFGYEQTDQRLRAGLVAHYLTGATGLNAFDSSGNQKHGVVNGNPQWDLGVDNKRNCLLYDGTGDYVALPTITALSFATFFTIALWVKVTAFVTLQGIISQKKDDTHDVDILTFTDQKLALVLRNGGETYGISQATYSTGVWYHLTWLYDGSQADNLTRMRLFVNGVNAPLDYTGTIPAKSPIMTETCDIGLYYVNVRTNPSTFNGLIDDVRIYNRTLSEAEVVLLANQSFLPITNRNMYRLRVPNIFSKKYLVNQTINRANTY